MEGIIINLLKDVQREDIDANQDTRQCFPNLVWMEYDRIQISKIDRMDDYFILSEVRDNWVGSIQSLHLYTEKASHRLEFNNSDGVLISPIDGEAPSFFCITSLKLNFDIKFMLEWEQQEGVSSFNCMMKSYLDSVLSELNCNYEIYNSLGAEDFVIIFVADSIKKFATLIEYLRTLEYINSIDEKKKIFETTYSFVGLNNINKIVEPGIEAMVSITVKRGADKHEYIELLKTKKIEISKYEFCFGTYDVRLYIKSSCALMQQYRDGLLSASTEQYKKYIYQSRTMWLYTNDDLEINGGDKIKPIKFKIVGESLNDGPSKLLETVQKHVETFKKIIEEQNIISQIPHFKEECRILLAEYNRYMNSSFIRQWWPDIAIQFKAFVESIQSFLKQNNKHSLNYGIEAIEECMEVIKETYMHITQASRLFFDSSERARHYNGSFNNILRAYYGLVKVLINIGYTIPHNICTEQDELAFAINFDVKPKIYSKLYLPESKSGMRFISFNLPYAAVYNMPKYLAYLVHEVFHYIAPIDRIARNKLLFKISLDIILRDLVYRFFCDTLNMGSNKQKMILKNLIASFFDCIIKEMIEKAVEGTENLNMYTKSSDFFVKELEDICLCKTPPYKLKLTELLKETITGILSYTQNDDICKAYIEEKETELLTTKEKNKTKNIFKQIQDFGKINKRNLINIIASHADHLNNSYGLNKGFAPISGIVQEISEGLSEAVCDLYILSILGLEFFEYIEILMDLFKDMLVDDVFAEIKKSTGIAKTDSISLRLGILVDACNGTDDNLEWLNNQLEKWEKVTQIKDAEKKITKIKFVYNQYLDAYKGYRCLINNYIQNMFLSNVASKISEAFGDDTLEEWKNDIDIVKKYYRRYLSAMNHINNQQELFTLNMDMIEFFQSQRLLKPKLTPSTVKFNVSENIRFSYTNSDIKVYDSFENVATSMSQYIEYVIEGIKELEKTAKDDNLDIVENMWFRGLCNSQYKLTPSIFRQVPQGMSLYTYQAALLKELHARTSSYPQLLKNDMVSRVEQIACMQHYGAPTSLLDFSTDFITALHFAMNPDAETDKKNIVDAAVYILHPSLFNRAMREMCKKQGITGFYPLTPTSVYNDDMLKDYIPIDCTNTCIIKKQETFEKNLNKNVAIGELEALPVAIIVPKTNDRIRSQYGTFVAFPLDIPSSTQNGFNYLDLECLQREYLKRPGSKPFLKKIIISSNCIKDLRKNLLHLGVTQSRMYPELDKILKTAGNVAKNYLQ